MDLYLYNFHNNFYQLKGKSLSAGSQETITLEKPSAGKWKAVIDPVSIPSGKTSIEYLDFFTHPVFGAIKSSDSPTAHSTNETWKGKARFQVDAMPVGKRSLIGLIEMISEKPETVGYKIDYLAKKHSPPVQQFIPLGTAIIQVKVKEAEQKSP